MLPLGNIYLELMEGSLALTKGQTHNSMEQNRESQNRLTQIRSTDFQKRCQDNLEGKEKSFQQLIME